MTDYPGADWYDDDDLAEWEAVLKAAVAAAKERAEKLVQRPESRLKYFQTLVEALADPALLAHARRSICALMDVPQTPLPQPTPPWVAPTEREKTPPEELREEKIERALDSGDAFIERYEKEQAARRAKAEEYFGNWDHAAGLKHLERIREYQAKCRKYAAEAPSTDDPERPAWPTKEWGPM